KMMEDNLYWALIDARWVDDANFAKGPVKFFRTVPAPIRPVVVALVRRKVRKALWAHGIGRHSAEEMSALASRSIDAMADFLGVKTYCRGSEPTGIDATAFPFAAGMLCRAFDTPVRTAAERRDNLVRYVDRMTAKYYPDLGKSAGPADHR